MPLLKHPPPKAPLYVYIDKQFREWWHQKGYPPLHAKDNVMRVKKALQGHPESPRLWATLIDNIIINLGFKSCTHEPNLYVNTNYKGNLVYFMRQVDDFAVSAETKSIAENVIEDINSKMTVKVRSLGVVNRFNGVDITQSEFFIKISNETYINKILKDKQWLNASIPGMYSPQYTPMHHDPEFNKTIEEAEPIPNDELKLVEKEFGFSYKQGIGELIYALVTCRPDISFPLIKLSQYSSKPARIHFDAVKGLYQYLKDTKSEGIHYWRKNSRKDLPSTPLPTTLTDYKNYDPHPSKTTHKAERLQLHVDASYAGDVTHRKSVTGIVAFMAGGSILYKTKYQDVIALSSTEAEFIAACEAGKNSLYIRSILQDLGLPQDQATIIYEDNQGAIAMANSGRPTKRTKHIDTRHFAIQSWVEQDLIELQRIPTNDNSSDSLTKNTPRLLFNRHTDYVLGRSIPQYSPVYTTIQTPYTQTYDALSTGG